MVEDRTQPSPARFPLTAAAENTIPKPQHAVPEAGQHMQIARNGVVLVVAP